MAETKKSFVFYCSYAEQLALLPKEAAADVVLALCSYVGDGVKPDLEDSASKMAFSFIAAQVDRDCSKWEAAAERRRNAAQNAAAARWKKAGTDAPACARMPSDAINAPDAVNGNGTGFGIGNGTGIKDDKEKAPKERRNSFKPPSVDAVRMYCNERNNKVNPERFVDFYTSKNWMIGKDRMRDWRAAIRTWEARTDTFKPVSPGITTRKTTFSNFEQRDDDLDDLARKAILKRMGG